MHADLPGFKKEDIHLHIDNGTLVLEAERKEEKTEDVKGYHIQERSWGKTSRSFRLPVNASTAVDPDIKFENGVLTMIFDKKADAVPKKLAIA